MKTLFDVAWQRLNNQFLLERPFARAAAVVEALGAVQAQDYPGAKWALAQRMSHPTNDAIEAAMTRGAIIRTHVLRPTWHFVTPADLRWMLMLTAPRVNARMKPYNTRMSLDASTFRRSNDAIARALSGGNQLTRQEIATELRGAGIKIQSVQHLAHLMMQAELDLVVCSGGLRGKQFTYALIDERVPRTEAIDRDEALLRLTRLYFRSRSPATLQDFSWWSGLTIGDAKRGAELAKLKVLTVEGRQYRELTSRRASPARTPVAHLLPNYDEYFIGHRDRSAIGARLRRSGKPWPEGSAFWNVVAVDGQLIGGWKRRSSPKGIVIELRLVLRPKPKERQAIAVAAAEYASFLGPSTRVLGL